VSLHDLAPGDTEAGSVLLRVSLGDVGDALAQVEVDIILAVQTLDLDQRGVVHLRSETTLEAKVDSLHVKAGRLAVRHIFIIGYWG